MKKQRLYFCSYLKTIQIECDYFFVLAYCDVYLGNKIQSLIVEENSDWWDPHISEMMKFGSLISSTPIMY